MGHNWQTVLQHPARRAVPGVQFRALDDKTGRFQARVIKYNVIDDYRTEFAPGVFAESLQARMPRVVWSHDWSEPLGRYIDADDTQNHLDLIGEFDDFDDVPRARQAYAQLKSGTIDEFSVGFMPIDGEEIMRDERSIFRFTRARLDEVSLVLAGAVPGTTLLAVRSKGVLVRSPIMVVSKDLAAKTILDMHHGDIDLADALQIIKNASSAPEETPPETPPPAPEEEEEEEEEEETPPAEEGEETETPPETLDESEFSDVDDILARV